MNSTTTFDGSMTPSWPSNPLCGSSPSGDLHEISLPPPSRPSQRPLTSLSNLSSPYAPPCSFAEEVDARVKDQTGMDAEDGADAYEDKRMRRQRYLGEPLTVHERNRLVSPAIAPVSQPDRLRLHWRAPKRRNNPTSSASVSTVLGASPSDPKTGSTRTERRRESSDLYHDADSQTDSGAPDLEGLSSPPFLATAQDAERIANHVISHLSDRYKLGSVPSSQYENLPTGCLDRSTMSTPILPDVEHAASEFSCNSLKPDGGNSVMTTVALGSAVPSDSSPPTTVSKSPLEFTKSPPSTASTLASSSNADDFGASKFDPNDQVEDLDGEPLLLEDQPTTDKDLSKARRKAKQKKLSPPFAPEDVMVAFNSHRHLFRRGSSGRPCLYETQDSFWMFQPSVSAAMERDTSTNTPSPLTSTPLFFHWDPMSLVPDGIRCPAAGCSNLLRYVRMLDRPRKVFANGLEQRIAFWITAPQYQCVGCSAARRHGSGATQCIAWDFRILDRLPHALRLHFPMIPTLTRTGTFIAKDVVVDEIAKQICSASGSPFSMRGVALPPSLVFTPRTEPSTRATPPQPTRASASNTNLPESAGWVNGSITPSSAGEVAWCSPSSPPHSSPIPSSSPQLQHASNTQTMSYRDLAASFQVSGGLHSELCRRTS